MKISIITLFPEIFDCLKYGVVSNAFSNETISLELVNPRDYATDAHRSVDDRPYGGGPGMVMLYEPLAKCMNHIQNGPACKQRTIYLSPQGQPLTQTKVKELADLDSLNLIAGRYEGVDQRFIDNYVDEEISIGDFVLSGGEIPALTLIDAIARLQPGVLGSDLSAENDSFSNGLLQGPAYTRPEEIDGKTVPSTLLSGHHEAISRWRRKESLGITWQKRPNLIKRRVLNAQDKALLDEFKRERSTPDEEIENV